MAGAEDGDVPGRRGAVEFEHEGHFPAAGHTDVSLEVPSYQISGGGTFLGEEGGGVGESAGFDFPAADGA